MRAGGTLFALTATCAANALGLVNEGAYSFAGREAALAAFGPLAARLKAAPERSAKRLLDGAMNKMVKAVVDALRHTSSARRCRSSRSGAQARRSFPSSPHA